MKYIVMLCQGYHEERYSFDNAAEAVSFAEVALSTHIQDEGVFEVHIELVSGTKLDKSIKETSRLDEEV